MSNSRRPNLSDSMRGGRDFVVMEDGHFLPSHIVNEIEAIEQYDPELSVYWVAPEDRSRNDEHGEFAIVHNPPGKEAYVAFFAKTEDFDGRVIKKVIINDQRNGSTSISEIEAHTKAKAALMATRLRDSLEEANDIALHALKSPLHNYKVNKDLTIKDDGRYGNGSF